MQTAIITGASEGLGLEFAKKFLNEGWNVVGISRHRPEGIDMEYIEGDLSKEEDIVMITDEIKEKYSDFKVLINCAGLLDVEKLEAIDFKKTESLFKVNVLAPMMLVSKLKENLLTNNSTVVNIGSTISFKAIEEQAAYGASKWALRGLSENLKVEFKGTGVRVISFNQGGTRTKIFEKAGMDVDTSKYLDPVKLANLLYYIVSMPNNIEVSEIVINRK
jgi:short-subunit dehydrogenase